MERFEDRYIKNRTEIRRLLVVETIKLIILRKRKKEKNYETNAWKVYINNNTQLDLFTLQL